MRLLLNITLFSMILLLVACQKEEHTNAGSMKEANRAKLERLNYFNQVLRKHHENHQVEARSSQSFSPGETRWALEAVMNINHAMRPAQVENLVISRHTLEIPLINNAVSEGNFYNAYISLYDSLVRVFEASMIPNKYFIGMVLANDTLMADKVRLKVKIQIASGTQAVPSCTDLFDRDYNIGAYQSCNDPELSGSCDGIDDDTNGTCLMGSYLNELIQEDLNHLNPDPQNFPWFGGFVGDVINFVDVAAFYQYYNDDFEPGDHPIKNCLMVQFYSSEFSGQPDYCISEENLNWLLCNHYDIAKSYSLQPGNHLAMIDLELDFSPFGNDALHGSFMEIYQGVPFFTNTSPGGGFVIGPAVPYADLMQSVVLP